MNRYARQILLPEVGAEGQETLKSAHVAVVGAGGLGCPALAYLAAAGVGHISLFDPDRVDLSNLQRQTLYTTADQGLPKVEVAALQLTALNPDIQVTPHALAISEENAESLLADHQVILDGSDNFPTRYLVSNTAQKLGIPLVFGALTGFEGQLAVFSPGGPCYRCLFPEEPTANIRNCAEAGVLGPVAGIIGSLMALEAEKIILGRPASPALTQFDGRSTTFRKLAIKPREGCAGCAA